jgi:membrane protein implicated in regulation of membrane protease activity
MRLAITINQIGGACLMIGGLGIIAKLAETSSWFAIIGWLPIGLFLLAASEVLLKKAEDKQRKEISHYYQRTNGSRTG